jgi:hypothetical protein
MKTSEIPLHISVSTPVFAENSPTLTQRKIYQTIAPQTWTSGAEMSRRLRDTSPSFSPIGSPTLRQHARLQHDICDSDKTNQQARSPLLQRFSLSTSHHQLHIKHPSGDEGGQ